MGRSNPTKLLIVNGFVLYSKSISLGEHAVLLLFEPDFVYIIKENVIYIITNLRAIPRKHLIFRQLYSAQLELFLPNHRVYHATIK